MGFGSGVSCAVSLNTSLAPDQRSRYQDVAQINHLLETARTIVKLIPNAKVAEMKHCSHWPQMEDPETFNSISLEFLRAR